MEGKAAALWRSTHMYESNDCSESLKLSLCHQTRLRVAAATRRHSLTRGARRAVIRDVRPWVIGMLDACNRHCINNGYSMNTACFIVDQVPHALVNAPSWLQAVCRMQA